MSNVPDIERPTDMLDSMPSFAEIDEMMHRSWLLFLEMGRNATLRERTFWLLEDEDAK